MAEFPAVRSGVQVVFATTLDNLTLPVVDVTNPAFHLSPSPDALAAMSAQYVKESGENREVPPEVRAALGRSRIGAGLAAARGTFLSGLSTYLIKLGPDNLTADFQPIDRRIAASFPAVTARLRVQDMAGLMSEGLAGALTADRNRPLRFVNIAGGTGSDSWNALIVLRWLNVDLAHRDVVVCLLDPDDQGPGFGARAIEALQTEGGPLHGLRVRFDHISYRWNDAGRMSQLTSALDLKQSLCAISSEGGLFEYGSDEEIGANLAALEELTAPDTVLVGSACREGQLTNVHSGIGVTLRPRSRDAFQRLAERAGWKVSALIERPFSDNVRLVKR